MRKLSLIGIGMGDPDDLTGHAVKALAQVDVVFAIEKGGARDWLVDRRRTLVERFCTRPGCRFVAIPDAERDRNPADYVGEVRDWHARRAEIVAASIEAELAEDAHGAILVWGDPSLYDSTIRVVSDIVEAGLMLDWDVIPGLTSLQLLTARHRMPLNTLGGAVEITTGRQLAARASDADTQAVMLDGNAAFAALDPDCEIAWGAYLGTENEILIRGRLGDVKDDIIAALQKGRATHGWIMDTYILRRPRRV